eukprot:symbB.v1.2.040247.t1/scaffold7099.1/size13327/2
MGRKASSMGGQKQQTWPDASQNAYAYEAEGLPWGAEYEWTQMQMHQTPYWPEQSWQYLQQARLEMHARLQMQAATTSRMAGGVDSLALPPSLEKRLEERRSKASSSKAKEAEPTPPPPPDQDFYGTIKSLSDRHGYGFISCDEVHRIYGRDTYVPQDLIPPATKVQDRVVFKLGLSKKGHPQVSQIRSVVMRYME